MSHPVPRLFLIRHGKNDTGEQRFFTDSEIRGNRVVSQWVRSDHFLRCWVSLIALIIAGDM
jgi:hypothetical protein